MISDQILMAGNRFAQLLGTLTVLHPAVVSVLKIFSPAEFIVSYLVSIANNLHVH